MAFDAITAALKDRFGEAVTEVVEHDVTSHPDPFVVVEGERLRDVLQFLRDDARTRLDHLSLISGVDYPKEGVMEVVYHLDSFTNNTPFVLKAKVSRDDCRVPSVVEVFKTADWHERECYDLMGIVFEGHPNLTRILCADDWVGHPLRKDYEWPESYHGIPCGPFAKEDKNIPPEWELEGFTTRNSG